MTSHAENQLEPKIKQSIAIENTTYQQNDNSMDTDLNVSNVVDRMLKEMQQNTMTETGGRN